MERKLFCELSPSTYNISVEKCRLVRKLKDMSMAKKFAKEKSSGELPVIIYKHNSLIRRRLGNVKMDLQENKAVNLSIAAPKVNHVLIKPGQIFSFWQLVGKTSEKLGYREGLTISFDQPSSGIGGGLCQFTNLIHWMVLHTSMTIIEHHHHDQVDLFPDFHRQIPFGTGTSIFYNYLDYRFVNNTDITYQLITYTTNEYLCGEIRADKPQKYSYHVKSTDQFFTKEGDSVFRNGDVYRITVDKVTGDHIKKELIRKNHARVLYDTSNLQIAVTDASSKNAE